MVFVRISVSELTRPCTEVLQGGRDVEGPSASKCAATNRRDNDQGRVRNDVGLDGERKYQ